MTSTEKFYNLYRESQIKFSKQMEKISYKRIPMGEPIPNGFKKVGIASSNKIYLFQ